MRVLLDTCVLAEFMRPKGNAKVRAAVKAIAEQDLFLSAISVGEIARGIALLKPGRKRTRYAEFLNDLRAQFGSRILSIDADCANLWGEIAGRASSKGKTLPVFDGLIAAAAIHHGLHVMTRNEDDFRESGVFLINPWE